MSELKNKDYTISFIRIIAMLSIIICHIMQRANLSTTYLGLTIKWATWFNLGVQMFLFISGYLYGKRAKIDIISFYKKAFSKILVDYYLFVIVMIIIYLTFCRNDINVLGILKLITFSGTINGLEHLWYIPTILVCYLFTPIFVSISKYICNKAPKIRFILIIFTMLIIQLVTVLYFGYFSPAWINCYFLGSIYANVELEIRSRKLFQNVILFLAIITNLLVLINQIYILPVEIPDAKILIGLSNYGHVFLGIIIAIYVRYLYSFLKNNEYLRKVLDICDVYSYDVYLVHHVFIQSPFACINYISNFFIAISIAILSTIIFAYILKKLSSILRKYCNLIWEYIELVLSK